MPNKASSQAEVIPPVNQVSEWMINGCRTATVYARASEKWGLSTRQTDQYIHRARKAFKEAADIKRQELVALSMLQFDNILEKSLESRQYSAAQAALVSKLRMVGCDAPKGL